MYETISALLNKEVTLHQGNFSIRGVLQNAYGVGMFKVVAEDDQETFYCGNVDQVSMKNLYLYD